MAESARPGKASGIFMETEGGYQVHLVLNFGLLRAISRKSPEAYGAALAAINGKSEQSVEAVYRVLWAAYLCGCVRDGSEPMGEDEFYVECGGDITGAMLAFRDLVDPNRRTPTAGRI